MTTLPPTPVTGSDAPTSLLGKRARSKEEVSEQSVNNHPLNIQGYWVKHVLDKDACTAFCQGMETQPMPSFASTNLGESPRVLGSFGAWGDPESFHNPIRRAMNQTIFDAIAPNLPTRADQHVQFVMDRFSKRLKGSKVGGESMHRDEAPSQHLQKDDVVLGGFVALSEDQFFSCVPGSHTDTPTKGSGFKKQKVDPQVKARLRNIRVPQGSCIVFYQRILHNVKATSYKADSYRLYCGWRLTKDPEPLFGAAYLEQVLRDQAVPKLPSGQPIPVYAKLHKVNWLDKTMKPHGYSLASWSKAVFSEAQREDYMRTTDGSEYSLARRFLPSLASQNQCFAPYTRLERHMLGLQGTEGTSLQLVE